MLEVVDVRAANSRLADLDEDLVGLDLGDGALHSGQLCPAPVSHSSKLDRRATHVLVLDIVDGVENKAWVV